MKLGLQLYTVKEAAEKDYIGTIKKVCEMGYQGIEFPGGTMEKIAAGDLKQVLSEQDAELIGIVFEKKDLDERMEKVLEYCMECACENVVFPWIGEEFRTISGYRDFASGMNEWGRILRARGINFLYHIHGYEFEDLGGTCGMDILTSLLDARYVNLEIDVYWVEWGGVDSVQFMREWGRRSPLIHFKDMKDLQSKRDIEVGDGCIDMRSIAKLGKEYDARWFIVEQEAFEMPQLESAGISLQNLKRIVEEIY